MYQPCEDKAYSRRFVVVSLRTAVSESLTGSKTRRGQVILARFIENPQQAMYLGLDVGLDLVELADFQRRLVVAKVDADYKLFWHGQSIDPSSRRLILCSN